MKYDNFGCLVREAEEVPGSYGDSAAETCRAIVLGDELCDLYPLVTARGYLRHPRLSGLIGWNEEDFSNDQLLPLLMALRLEYVRMFREQAPRIRFAIPGTKTIVSIGCFAVAREWYWLLNIANVIQGWVFKFPWRWSDSKKQFEQSEASSADWLNYVVTYVFLRRIGARATLNQSVEKCLEKVRDYYQRGADPEMNSEWIVALYERALK